MNIFLQIGIGLIPGAAATAFLLIRRKAFSVKRILGTLLLLTCCISLTVIGSRGGGSEEAREKTASRGDMLELAAALYIEGGFEQLKQILEEYSTAYGYDDNCRLMQARMYLAKEQYEEASGLYACLAENDDIIEPDAEEISFAVSKLECSEQDMVMLNYLQEIGADVTEYGYTAEGGRQTQGALKPEVSEILESICEELEEKYRLEDSGASACAKFLTAEKEEADREEEEADREEVLEALERVGRQCPELLTLECVKQERLKALVVAGEFESLVEELDEQASYHETMIAAELYMGGLVRAGDFPDAFRELDSKQARAVKNQVKTVFRENRDGLTQQEEKSLQERVNAIEEQLEQPELTALKKLLQQSAEEEAETDRTKIYLELAKIENYFGNEMSADSYIKGAIYESQECGDDSYAYAMSQIIGVLDGSGAELENIKNVPEYVAIVADNSLTVDVEEILSANIQAVMAETEQESGQGSNREQVQRADSFPRSMVDYVSRVKSAVSIGSIQTEKFPEISARIQLSSSQKDDTEALGNVLEVSDCGIAINDFSLEKLEYSGVNIMLCCDVSGSMSNSMDNLRSAISTFVAEKNRNENLAVTAFNSVIVAEKPFGTPDSELTAFAQELGSGGGTDIYSSVQSCLGNFPDRDKECNVLIVLTDGQDGSDRSALEIYNTIGAMALDKKVTIYTVGLGDSVDTGYLTTIANSANGSFVYVSSSESLNSFFDTLHGQIYNQYRLTYEAADTMLMEGRILELALPEEGLYSSKTYSLTGEDGETGENTDIARGLSLSGISPRTLYKSRQDVTVELRGTGFDETASVSVRLNGNIDYDIEAKYVSENTYSLTIPSGTAVGTYNVEVTIDGKKTVLQRGFSVAAAGPEKTTAFGKYVFTSAEKIENADGSCLLRGNVRMNGWLCFKGEVKLSGDLESGGSIQVEENAGSYVQFSKSTAQGVGKLLAEKGIALDIMPLYRFRLYYDETMADDIQTGFLAIHQLMQFDSPAVQIYPDNLQINFRSGSTILPYQDKILKTLGQETLFKFNAEGAARITDRNVGIVFEASAGDADSKNYNRKINLFNSPVYFNGSVKIKIDTLKNEYLLGAMVHMAFFADGAGVGAELAFKGFTIDSAMLKLEFADGINLPTTIPITIDDFSFQVSDIAETIESGNWKNLEFLGTISLSSGNISQLGLSSLKKYLGDVTLLKMPDTSASVRIQPFKAEAEAKLVFLEEITLAEAGLKFGSFEYSNSMLDLDEAEVEGLSAKLKAGVMWNSADDRIKLELSGTGELDAHSRFVGIGLKGTGLIDVKWWLFHAESKTEGDICFGLYRTESGKNQFVLVTKYVESNGKVKGSFYYIDENGNAGRNRDYLR